MIELDSLMIPEGEQEAAKEIVAKLLRSWCIPREKNNECRRDFNFIDSHVNYFSTLLSLCGFTLVVSKSAGMEVAYLVDGNPLNRWKMNKEKSIVFLRLFQTYLENMVKLSLSGGDCVITVEDLQEKVNVVSRNPMDIPTLEDILFLFDEFNLVQVCVKRKKDFSMDTIIRVLPSVTKVLPNAKIENITSLLESYCAESSRKSSSLVLVDNTNQLD